MLQSLDSDPVHRVGNNFVENNRCENTSAPARSKANNKRESTIGAKNNQSKVLSEKHKGVSITKDVLNINQTSVIESSTRRVKNVTYYASWDNRPEKVNITQVEHVGKTSLPKHNGHVVTDVSIDKYSLDIHLKPKTKQILNCAKGNPTFERWAVQKKEKFGFIPLGNCIIPNTDDRVVIAGSLLDIHEKIENTRGYNFQNAQVLVPPKFNLKLWEQ